MTFRPILGVPILLVALGMGALFSLPLLMASIGLTAPAGTCRVDVMDNVKKADRILIGRVEGVLGSDRVADVWIEPQTWYKGKSSKKFLRIQAVATRPGRAKVDDDLSFASDRPAYLLFLRQVSGGQYRTSRCYGSRVLGAGLTTAEAQVLKAQD